MRSANAFSTPAATAQTAPRRLVILGATGSIGRTTRDVILEAPDQFVVEAVVGGHRQALVQVGLDHVHAAAHAGELVGVGKLDAVAAAAARALQQLEQRDVAAAEVEIAAALGPQSRAGLLGGLGPHACSIAMP